MPTIDAIDEKIALLEEKLKKEKEKKRRIEAIQRAQLSKVTRQQDTRRKILVGAMVLAKVECEEWPKEKLLAMLDSSLTRDDDRALFDLPTKQPFSTHPESKIITP